MTEHIHGKGDVIGKRYRIQRFIGEGGMQEVYKATDLTFDRFVAVKAPKNSSAARRFDRSARLSARVNHPNVAKTLDYVETKERAYLVEEFIEGENLQVRLEQEFFYLDPYLAAHVFHHLAKAVAASHHAKVVHRDLKPSNIMVSDDAELSIVKITDFGIAKMAGEEIAGAVEAKHENSITGSKTVIGAVPFMAPETFNTPRKVSYPADVWALGAILYALCSGQPPFGSGLPAIAGILGTGMPDKPSHFGRALLAPVIDDLWGLIRQCLNREAAERPSADDLVSICASLCYSTARRGVGRVASYKQGSGEWGFIHVPNEEDVFFHISGYYGPMKPQRGALVNFACFPGDPRRRAFPVLPVKEEEP
jgi:serine/threonine protein kinase